jgi:hypothetical protein
MNGTKMGLRISSPYLCAFKLPSIKCSFEQINFLQNEGEASEGRREREIYFTFTFTDLLKHPAQTDRDAIVKAKIPPLQD